MSRQFLVIFAILAIITGFLWFRQSPQPRMLKSATAILLIQTPYPLDWITCPNLVTLGFNPCYSHTIDFEPEIEPIKTWLKIQTLWINQDHESIWAKALTTDGSIHIFSNVLPIRLYPERFSLSVLGYPFPESEDDPLIQPWSRWVEGLPNPWIVWFLELPKPDEENWLEKQIILDLALLKSKNPYTRWNWVIWQLSYPSVILTNKLFEKPCPCQDDWLRDFFQNLLPSKNQNQAREPIGPVNLTVNELPTSMSFPSSEKIPTYRLEDLPPQHQSRLWLLRAAATKWKQKWKQAGWDFDQYHW